MNLQEQDLTDRIIRCAIEVHRELGPGLMESSYEPCLCYELTQEKLRFERQHAVPLRYKGITLEEDYRLDLVVENKVILELKAAEKILPVHEAQLLTYLRLTEIHVGLLINFHEPLLKNGIKRMVL